MIGQLFIYLLLIVQNSLYGSIARLVSVSIHSR